MNHRRLRMLCVAGCLFTALINTAFASVMVGGTRVVFEEAKQQASLSIKNDGKTPYVVQTWVDAGEGNNQTPFFVTPPLSRLDPGKENILRILRASDAVAADRESVYWLNVKEIPPKAQGDNSLQIAMRTRIKLFYRPAGLPGKADSAPEKLTWSLVPDTDARRTLLKIDNPTAYHVTLAVLDIASGADREVLQADMIAPGQSVSVPVKLAPRAGATRVTYSTINDFGAVTPKVSLLLDANGRLVVDESAADADRP